MIGDDRMKRLTHNVLVWMILLILAGCSFAPEKNKKEPQKDSPELTAQQVFQKGLKAAAQLNNYSVDMNMDQELSFDIEQKPIRSKLSINADVMVTPLTIYELSEVDTDQAESKKVEKYLTDKDIYIYDSGVKKWMKFPKKSTEDLGTFPLQERNVHGSLELLEPLQKKLKVKEKKDRYILSISLPTDTFKDTFQSEIYQLLPPEIGLTDDQVQSSTMKSITQHIYINKKTFNPERITTFIKAKQPYKQKLDQKDTDGKPLIYKDGFEIKMTMDSKYYRYNKEKVIMVPSEIKENSIEMN